MAKYIWLILFIILLLRMSYENKLFEITRYKIHSRKLPKEFHNRKVLLLTDLHNNLFGKKNEKLLDAIHKEKPDCILIAGDMLVGHSKADNSPAKNLVKELAHHYPVYYSLGNHEKKLSLNPLSCDSTYKDYVNSLKEANVNYMVNQEEILYGVSIVGLDIDIDYYKKRNCPAMTKEYLDHILGSRYKDRYTILLAHNPIFFKDYAKWGADLILSGHVHGGIIRFPKLGGFISPQYKLFPTYDNGEFREGDSTMILSRGLGSHTIKLRLFNKPELIVINFCKELQY